MLYLAEKQPCCPQFLAMFEDDDEQLFLCVNKTGYKLTWII